MEISRSGPNEQGVENTLKCAMSSSTREAVGHTNIRFILQTDVPYQPTVLTNVVIGQPTDEVGESDPDSTQVPVASRGR